MSVGVSADKPLELLRSNIADLEAILKQRKRVFRSLASEATPSNGHGGNGNNTSSSGGGSHGSRGALTARDGDDNASAAPSRAVYRSPVDEARQLAQRNAFLREQLAKVQALAQQRANDPRVLDKRNEVRAVERQIGEVEAEIATLSVVQRRRNAGLRAIDKDEQRERRVRREQQQRSHELRAQVKELTEQLRHAKREDIDAHAHYTRLLEVAKLNVRETELRQLEQTVSQQEAMLAQLRTHEQQVHEEYAQKRQRQLRERDAMQRQLKQERHERRQLELMLAKLQKQLRWHTSPFPTTTLTTTTTATTGAVSQQHNGQAKKMTPPTTRLPAL